MKSSCCTILFFPGAGGEVPDLFGFESEENKQFEAVAYPEWRLCGEREFTTERLLADLDAQIAAKAPRGSIQVVGYSIGAHLAYCAALRLLAGNRQVTGFCVLDSFMIRSISPSPGWQRRALTLGIATIRAGRLRDFVQLIRSKFYRAMLRLSPKRFPDLLCKTSPTGLLGRAVNLDKVLCKELTVHLLVQKLAPLLRKIDFDPAILAVPTILLRTRENMKDDQAWRLRCPNLQVIEISGQHESLFDSENIISLQAAFATAMQRLRSQCQVAVTE